MAHSSAEQMRQWQGPALFSYGFRPFFLFGALWAGGAMVLWILALSGAIQLPTRFDPVAWHAHAFLFGYLSAIIAGFLLTAVPNWTGRLPVVGPRLAVLFAVWAVGRAAVLFSAALPVWGSIVLDLMFPLMLAGVILREIVVGKNWRNLIVLVLLSVFTLANLMFHLEAARGASAAQGMGLRLGISAVILMIAVIGGRIVPSFTRNWLAREGHTARPTPPMQRFDKAVLLVSVAVFWGWVIAPTIMITGLGLCIIGVLHSVRLSRWKGQHTMRDPLVFILHLAYGFIPLGALAMGAAILWPDFISKAGALHLWMAGAIGGMTLAVMTRASLGHTGQDLRAGRGTVVVYGAIIAATLMRFVAGVWPLNMLYDLIGALWCVAFFGFAGIYGPLLWRVKKAVQA
ncbi:NnrS family protein [Celeribacter baekdonensis]|uniref:NnrS family protein n=1 Tax=Celeribacter baekdonensis TaxID=875171 RepID=UPI003A8F28C3